MSRFIGLAVAGVFLTGMGPASAAEEMHLRLTKSQPAAEAVLESSPDTVRLWYNQEPELSVSAITIEGAGEPIRLDVVETDDPLSIAGAVTQELAAGSYSISWRTAGDDGHIRRGTVPFTIRAAR